MRNELRLNGLRPQVVPRWVIVLAGVVLLGAGLLGAAGPFEQTRDFRGFVKCEQSGGGCFGTEVGSVVGRRIYTTTTTHNDPNGFPDTTTITHHEVTWQRADGTQKARDVAPEFHNKVVEGQAVDLRLWKGEVVGLQAGEVKQWFQPQPAKTLSRWLYLVFFGLGVLLWGLLFGWWDGLFLLVFRTLAWMFMSFLPIGLVNEILTYGITVDRGFVVQAVFSVVFTGVSAAMLLATFKR